MKEEALVVFGRAYPVARRLDAPWFLVVHPNGLALARPDDAPGGSELASLNRAHEGIPDGARDEAINWLQAEAWPAIKAKFFPEVSGS